MSDPVPASEPVPAAGCLLRLFAMLFGFAILIVTGLVMLSHGEHPVAEGVWWGTVAAMLLARWLEIRRYAGKTAMGAPATMKHWAVYAGILVAVAAAARGLIAVAA